MPMNLLNGGIDEESTTPYVATGSSSRNDDNDDDDDGTSSGVIHRAEESHTRSLVKGLTWRFIASFTTVVIAKIVTGETGTSQRGSERRMTMPA